MADRPILFSAAMAAALWAGRKTQTRRVLNPQPVPCLSWSDPPAGTYPSKNGWSRLRYAPGDRLWVREPWLVSKRHDDRPPRDLLPRTMTVVFEAGGSIANQDGPGDWRPVDWPACAVQRPDWLGKLRPGMFLPRWASRMTAMVETVRVERLQDISEEDAIAEGLEWYEDEHRPDRDSGWQCYPKPSPGSVGVSTRDPRVAYRTLWDAINGPGAWEANPWVAVYGLRVERANIDTL